MPAIPRRTILEKFRAQIARGEPIVGDNTIATYGFDPNSWTGQNFSGN